MSRIIKQDTIRLASGDPAVLSASEIGPHEFEVMLASPDFGTEYTVRRSESEAWAICDYNALRAEYHAPLLSGRYAKLADDLRQAAEVGYAAAAKSRDGGTCNFDAVCLKLKGWSKSLVGAAAKQAGCPGYEWRLYSSKYWVFPLPGAGQADARTDAAEAMRDFLKAQGYEASVYYQMD